MTSLPLFVSEPFAGSLNAWPAVADSMAVWIDAIVPASSAEDRELAELVAGVGRGPRRGAEADVAADGVELADGGGGAGDAVDVRSHRGHAVVHDRDRVLAAVAEVGATRQRKEVVIGEAGEEQLTVVPVARDRELRGVNVGRAGPKDRRRAGELSTGLEADDERAGAPANGRGRSVVHRGA